MNLIGSILIDSIAYGMVLFVISVGLSITLGLMRFVNLAHGVFAVGGGYCAVALGQYLGFSYELAFISAVLIIAALSFPLERFLFRRMYGRSELDQVLFSIGLVFVSIALFGMTFGNGLVAISLPSYLSGGIDLGFRVVPAQRLAVVAVGLLVLLLLWWLLQKTRFGIETRAAVDNVSAARAVGIRASRVYAYAFALGSGMAAIGGILGAELLPMEAYYPLKHLVVFLAVVAVGGQGNPLALMAAALLLGAVETTAKYFVPELASILFFSTMLIVLSVRPAGLFAKEA